MAVSTLKKKTVLITGAASGIGLESAREFARHGAHLILTDINEVALAQAKAKVEALGASCETAICDVGDYQSVSALAAEVEKNHGALDVLLNNAGIGCLSGFQEHSLELWQKIHQINVMGVVHGINAFLPAMQSAGGPRHIVNLASVAAVAPPPNMAAYAASKAAVKNLSEVLAMELDGSNIVVQIVYPGVINTPIVDGPTGSNITQEQIERLRAYYQAEGCDPGVVAKDIVAGVLKGKAHIFSGPMSSKANLLSKLPRSIFRRACIKTGNKAGYLAAK